MNLAEYHATFTNILQGDQWSAQRANNQQTILSLLEAAYFNKEKMFRPDFQSVCSSETRKPSSTECR